MKEEKKKKNKREKTTELLWKLSKRTIVSEQQLYLRPPSQKPHFFSTLILLYKLFIFTFPLTASSSIKHLPEEEGNNRNTAFLVDTRKRTTALLTATFTKPRFFSTPIQTLYFQIPVSGMLQYSRSRGSPLSRASNVNHL